MFSISPSDKCYIIYSNFKCFAVHCTLFNYVIFTSTGMVERCHRTLESVMKKVIERQEDLSVMLNSVLFTMHCYTHSSTGFSPI